MLNTTLNQSTLENGTAGAASLDVRSNDALRTFIESHGFQTKIGVDGTLQGQMVYTRPGTGGFGFTQWEVIQPTIAAVREWLGY